MLTNFFDRLGFLPTYKPEETRRAIPPQKVVKEKKNIAALAKEFEKEMPKNIKPNEITGNLERSTNTEFGIEFEVIKQVVKTKKTVAQDRVMHLTDFDKALIFEAGIDPVKAIEVKRWWATKLPNGKYMSNPQITQKIGKKGMGLRNVTDISAVFSKALIEESEAKKQ